MPAKVTVQDIARHCGVSQTTVYEILGRSAHRYRPETQDMVRAAAAELGYRPNAAARAVSVGRFGMIGVVTSAPGQAPTQHRSDFLPGIEEAAEGSSVVFARVAADPTAADGSRLLVEDAVDGLIILPEVTDDQLRRLDPRVPVVRVNRKLAEDAVYPDECAAARRVTTMLLGSAAAGVVYVDQSRNPHASASDRRDGYLQAMVDAGRRPDLQLGPNGVADDDWPRWVRSWLPACPRPLGVVAYGASTALLVLRVALELGWRLPEDLRLATFAGPEIGDFRYLPMACLYIPQRDMGRAAMRMLLERIAAGGASRPAVTVPYDPAWDMVTREMRAALGR